MRTIAHLDMDAFYVSIELLRRPELVGKAVVVSGSGPRAVITTASYRARADFGIGSAMPLSRALRLCPKLIVIPPDFQTYREVSRKIMAILHQNIDLVQVAGLDEAYLDLTEFHSPQTAMQRIRVEIGRQTGLTCSIGIGPNKLLAKIASGLEKPSGTVTLTRELAAKRFANESPGLIPGIGPKTVKRLNSMGIHTIGELCRQPEDSLQLVFGQRLGAQILRRSRFEDDSPVTAERDTKSQSTEVTFDVDVIDHAQLAIALSELATELCKRLRANGLRGKNVAIKVRLDNWITVTRAVTLKEATNDPAIVGRVANELLTKYDPARPVRLLGVKLAAFEQSETDEADRPTGQGQLEL